MYFGAMGSFDTAQAAHPCFVTDPGQHAGVVEYEA
jgi:hypothetical protein